MTRSTLSRLLALTGLLFATACATAERYTDKPMTKRDDHTSYAIDETPSGFVLYVWYERYQFIPESAAVDQSATSQMLSLAHEIAEQRGKRIEPLNEQRIRKSMGRNGFTGITSWSGTVPATYVVDRDPPRPRVDSAPLCYVRWVPNKA